MFASMELPFNAAKKVWGLMSSAIFSNSEEPHNHKISTHLAQVLESKAYWVSRQREVFSELHDMAMDERLTSDGLVARLDELSDTLGVNLGSPAVMLLELDRIRQDLKFVPLRERIDQKLVVIKAFMHINPESAYANFLADVELMLDEMNFAFINSPFGRVWLSIYRDFLSKQAYDHALGQIEAYAMSKFYDEFGMASQAIRRDKAWELIEQFQLWRQCERVAPRSAIEPKVLEAIPVYKTLPKIDKQSSDTTAKGNATTSSTSWLNRIKSLITVPVKILQSHPWLSTGMVLAGQAVVTIAQQAASQGRVIAEQGGIRSSSINEQFFVNDLTHTPSGRRLSNTILNLQGGSIEFCEGSSSAFSFSGGEAGGVNGGKIYPLPDGSNVLIGSIRWDGFGTFGALIARYNQSALIKALALGGDGHDSFSGLELTPEGVLIAVGESDSYLDEPRFSALVVRFSCELDVEWSTVFNMGESAQLRGAFVRPSGNILVTGETLSGNWAPMIAELNQFGQVLSVYKLPFDDSTFFSDAHLLADGSIDGVLYNQNDRFYLLNMEANGQISELKAFKPSDNEPTDKLSSFKLHKNEGGEMVVAGELQHGHLFNAVIFRFSNITELESSVRVRHSPGGTRLRTFAVKSNGSIVLAGGAYEHPAGDPSSDIALLQISSDSEIEWAKTIGRSVGRSPLNGGTVSAIEVSENDDLLTAGYFHGESGGDFVLNKFNPHDDPLSLASDWFFSSDTEPYSIVDMEFVNAIVPSIIATNIFSSLSQTNWTSISVEEITSQLRFQALTAVPNIEGFQVLPQVAIMHQWRYVLPSVIFQGLAQQPQLRLDAGDAPWIRYDPAARTLYGTPGIEHAGPTTVKLLPEGIYTAGAGVFRFKPILLHLNIAESGRDLGWLRQDSRNSTLLQPVLTQEFNEPFALDLLSVLGPDVHFSSIVERSQSILPNWLSYAPTIGVLSGTPTGSDRGVYHLEINLLNGPDSQQISFAINVTNTVPYLSGGNVYNATVGRFSIPLADSMTDNEGDEIGSFMLSRLGTKSIPRIFNIDAVTGELEGIALSGDQGSYSINVSFSDPYSTGWEEISINIVNRRPYLVYDFVQPIQARVGETTRIEIGANQIRDNDGDELFLSLLWPSRVPLPSIFFWISFDGHVIRATPSGGDRGSHSLDLHVSDGFGGEIDVRINLDVVNTPPYVRRQGVDRQATLFDSSPVEFVGPEFWDAEGDTLRYSAKVNNFTMLPAWVSYNLTSNEFAVVPSKAPLGDHRFSVTANDGEGGQSVEEFNFRIYPAHESKDSDDTMARAALGLSIAATIVAAGVGFFAVRECRRRPNQSPELAPAPAGASVPDGGNGPGGGVVM